MVNHKALQHRGGRFAGINGIRPFKGLVESDIALVCQEPFGSSLDALVGFSDLGSNSRRGCLKGVASLGTGLATLASACEGLPLDPALPPPCLPKYGLADWLTFGAWVGPGLPPLASPEYVGTLPLPHCW